MGGGKVVSGVGQLNQYWDRIRSGRSVAVGRERLFNYAIAGHVHELNKTIIDIIILLYLSYSV